MRKAITLPKYVLAGIRANTRDYPLPSNLVVIGADTETVLGEPHAVQAFDGEATLFEYVTPETILPVFLEWIFRRARTRGVNLVYFHNLRFDLPVLFYKNRLDMYEQVSEIAFDVKTPSGVYEVKMLYGKINKATIVDDEGTEVHLLDSRSFTQTSFDRSLKMFKVPYSKLPKPEGLGVLPLRSPEFRAYAVNDAVAEYHLARRIMEFHEKFGVRPSISLPQFAARVFRRHFMHKGDIMPFPPRSVVKPSEYSYHGGKNGFYLDGPTVVEDAYELDISSAYPDAMVKLPQFMKGDYARVGKFTPGYCGVYRISGADIGKYPLVFDDNFKPVHGTFSSLWVTGFELERVLASKDCEVAVEEGFVWVPDPKATRSPLRDYVEHFYKLKESTNKDDPSYYFYKIALNALYGKFLQCVEVKRLRPVLQGEPVSREAAEAMLEGVDMPGDIDYVWDAALGRFVHVEREWKAGGLYHPFIGTQITGFVRGYLYDLETKYEAFHSATDAIKTTRPVKAVPGLGGVKVETFGRCYAFRNKLYLHFARSGEYCHHKAPPFAYPDGHPRAGEPLVDFDGQHLCKVGMHGFKGRVWELFDARRSLVSTGKLAYDYQHMVTLREGVKRRERVCHMAPRSEVIDLAKRRGPLPKRPGRVLQSTTRK